MSSISLRPDSPGADQSATDATGTLRIEVPHWAAQVAVYDNSLERLPGLSAVKERPEAAGVYEAEITLPPGIYQVETSLADQAERELVAVRANSTTTVAQTRWQALRLPSAAPLTGTADTREPHARAAEEWSRATTWPAAPGGDGRLFLFLGTPEPQRARSFMRGLYLLDAEGRLVTDFSEGVRYDSREGWMAFNADLPAGFYILRRSRAGVRLRYQPLYLTAGWETQVFLESAPYPRLHTLTVNMARRGAGFRPDDDSAVAADAILEHLGRAGGSEIPASEKLTALVAGKLENPWLAIVAGYALRAAENQGSRKSRPAADAQSARLLLHVLTVVQGLGDHPDARALLLTEDKPATLPFWHPPMLRVGLKRVQAHATAHADTVPLDCLTDCVLDNVITNSPWTAWRELDRQPRPAPEAAGARRHRGKRMLKTAPATRSTAPPTPAAVYADAIAQAAPPEAPVFPLGDSPELDDLQLASIQATLLRAAGTADATAHDTPLLRTAQAVVHGAEAPLPDTILVDVDRGLTKLLNTVQPKEVSTASGLPLARAEQGLERLRAVSRTGAAPPADAVAADPALASAQQAVVGIALQKAVRPVDAVAPTAPTDAPAGDPAATADPGGTLLMPAAAAATTVTIEESVAKIADVADRLLAVAEPDADAGARADAGQARDFADRLYRAADALLRRADFTAITDSSGRLISGNGALKVLLAADGRDGDRAVDAARRAGQEPSAHLAAWGAALAALPPGAGTLTAPIANPISAEWNVQRTAVEDATSKEVRAFLSVLRAPGAPRLSPTALGEIDSMVTSLTLYAPLFAYGSPADRAENARIIESLITGFEHLLDRDEAPPPGAGG